MELVEMLSYTIKSYVEIEILLKHRRKIDPTVFWGIILFLFYFLEIWIFDTSNFKGQVSGFASQNLRACVVHVEVTR